MTATRVSRGSAIAAWGSTAAAVLFAVFWSRELNPALVWAAAGAAVVTLLLAAFVRRERTVKWLAAAWFVTVAAVVVAGRAERQFVRAAHLPRDAAGSAHLPTATARWTRRGCLDPDRHALPAGPRFRLA